MKLTDKTDYSLRVLIFLLNRTSSDERCKIQEIADYFHISKNHLKVVVNQLADLGVIISFTGPTGGIVLHPRALHLKLGDLVQQLEDLGIVECLSSSTPSQCVIDGRCQLKRILSKSTKAFVEELNRYRISDLKIKL